MKLVNVLAKAGKGAIHGLVGFTAFGLYSAAHFWQPDVTNPAVALLWPLVGTSAGVALSQGVGRLIGYKPEKDPRNPAYRGE